MGESLSSARRLEANKAVIRQHLEDGVTNRTLDVYDVIMHRDYVLHVGSQRNLLGGGREGYKSGLGSFQAAFPDMRIELLDLIAEGDQVLAHYIERGTHSGAPYRGRSASGRTYEKHGFGLYRVHDGQMVEGWVQEDELAFRRALGLNETTGT